MPRSPTRPTLSYLLAARRCELAGLELLDGTCALVTRVSDLVHVLQKERGYSNVYLSSGSDQLAPALASIRDAASAVEQQLRDFLAASEPDAAQTAARARLINCIAQGLYWLDELPDLRWQVRERRIATHEATVRFTRLIGALLSIVFEAADSALDPDVTRTLVALFNFMQGKELSGQERAHGVMGFTAGYFSAEEKLRMADLLERQLRSFEIFAQYASGTAQQAWREAQAAGSQIEPMRKVALNTQPDMPVDPSLCELWYDVCTERIDAMRSVERLLTAELGEQCRRRIDETRAELDNHRLLLNHFGEQLDAHTPALLFNVQARVLGTVPPDGVGQEMERSLLDLIRAQTARMQETEAALHSTRSALDERRLIEQAKWLLIARHGLTEQAAHDKLQQAAMNHGVSLGEIARRILDTQRGEAGANPGGTASG